MGTRDGGGPFVAEPPYRLVPPHHLHACVGFPQRRVNVRLVALPGRRNQIMRFI